MSNTDHLKTCTFCDTAFETVEARREHEVEQHPMSHIEELEHLLDAFQQSADKAVHLKQEKERLQEKLEQLQDNDAESATALRELNTTKNRLEEQLSEREHELQRLKQQVNKTDANQEGDSTNKPSEPSSSSQEQTPVQEPKTDASPATVPGPTPTPDDTGDEEVELHDPETPQDDTPTLHGVKDSISEVGAWQGFDDTSDGSRTNTDIRNRIVSLEHENKELRTTIQATEDVFERVKKRSEEVAERLDDG